MVRDSEANNSVYNPDIVFNTYKAAQNYVNEDNYHRNQYKIICRPFDDV